MPHLIKRYSNRKLYDPETSRYVTLDDLKQLIRDGAEVRVEDAASGEDLTSLTLTQILLETERTRQVTLPSTLLHQLIKQGDAWYSFLQRMMRTNSFDHLPMREGDAERFWNQWASLSPWRTPSPPAPAASPEGSAPGPANLEREIATLKEHLLALEKRLSPKKRRPARRRARQGVSRRGR